MYKSLSPKPIFSVSDFVAIFNQTIDYAYPEVVIVGELSNFKVSKNIWLFFDLKDEQANLKCFGTVRLLPGPLEDGLVLEVTGKPYLHPQFGFSINITNIKVSGQGSINKAYKLLEQKLAKEGLFSSERKRPIDYPPTKIGLITSKESAGYEDFIKIINNRWPKLGIEVFDTLVQGRDAPEKIISAIVAANNAARLEAIVILRGGGSRDDLVAFDHEQVVRAIATSRVPTLVAIGHERDVVLSELVADKRASTPSNAAEILVPDRQSELSELQKYKKSIDYILNVRVQAQKDQFKEIKSKFNKKFERLIANDRHLINSCKQILKLTDPQKLLEKGYALVQDSSGNYIASAKVAIGHHELKLIFKDGKIKVKQ